MKERITLTLDRDILRRVDGRVDGSSVKNRSHAIELLVRKALKGSLPTTAVILAGGRLPHSKTEELPKSLALIGSKPILQYNLELCKRYGITDIILCLGPKADVIKERFGDGTQYGVRITYLEEDAPLGTAGPLRELKGRVNEPFVVMNGDELKDINLLRLFQAHLDTSAKVTIALTTVEDPSAYGVALLDGTRIMRFVEKPSKEDAPSKLINAGLYLMEPEVLDLIPQGFATVEHDVFPKLAKEGVLHGYPFSGQWFDTGSAEHLERAKHEWKGFIAEQ
jgi:NDP-sugar pyrophosphorylase family protein